MGAIFQNAALLFGGLFVLVLLLCGAVLVGVGPAPPGCGLKEAKEAVETMVSDIRSPKA
jgi:hypothetical protein